MKAILIPAALGIALAGGFVGKPAEAAGCLKGAVVGGLAGHLVHHGVLGAMAGCAVGHHEASKQERTVQENRNTRNDYGGNPTYGTAYGR